MKQFNWITLGFFFGFFQSSVNNPFGGGLLAVKHQVVHELGQNLIAVLRIWKHFAFLCAVTS